MQARGPY